MYYNATKKLSYLLIVAGIILFVFGLWQYMPHSYRSDTSDQTFMSIEAKRIVFPLVGLILTLIGITLSKFVGEVETEMLILRDEIIQLTNRVDKLSNHKN
ncbi:hypothetical protein [Paenibacillus glycanilyticus]|uniref:Dolichol-phosphate mannosyltransferase subunit 3 n=1 Tax=Paenibacillus glycanilyticus TaxID=126569 RepID=A0ABQ6GKC2_9BACL|nr:hypothetical protein [Paenibacillus glycanilyticus]GLX70510.1 hypothetical protein MU1_48560 [Paenibacillus glycanilyticus]